ncbi:MAG: PaaI family thioesterase [Lautropia sp.]
MTASQDPAEQGWEREVGVDEFAALVGPLLSRTRNGDKEYAFVAASKHLSRYARVHGGMLMWLMDKALAMKAWEAAGRPEQIATIQLDVQFLSAVEESSLVESRCTVVRKTGSLVFMTGQLLSAGTVLVSASGVWKYR